MDQSLKHEQVLESVVTSILLQQNNFLVLRLFLSKFLDFRDSHNFNSTHTSSTQCKNSTNIAVILSLPCGCMPPLEIFSSKKFSNTVLPSFCCESSPLICVMSGPESSSNLSQIPSQATTMNSYFPLRSISRIYGRHMMGCMWKGIFGTDFCEKSPRDLVRFRLPLTRPSIIWAPAFRIRSFQLCRLGLWSYVRGQVLPSRYNTARESPALATMILSGETTTTTAVHPAISDSFFKPVSPVVSSLYLICSSMASLDLSMRSICMKVSFRARPICFSLRLFLLRNSWTKCFYTQRATSSPPWPSNTPNRLRSGWPSRVRRVSLESYMYLRQPCISQLVNRRCSLEAVLVFFSVIGLSRNPPMGLLFWEYNYN